MQGSKVVRDYSVTAINEMLEQHRADADWPAPWWADPNEFTVDFADEELYEVSIIFEGVLDEDFEIATNAPELVCLALYNSCVTEYTADPDSELGFTVELQHPGRGEIGDTPEYRMRFSGGTPKILTEYTNPN